MQQKTFLRGALTALTLAASMHAWADTYPERTVHLIIPFPPGGTLDTLGRALAQKLSDQTKQSFVVENRAGGNGIIGANAVAKASADGYTLLFSASTFTTAPMTMRSVPYSVEKDFTPVALAAKAPLSIAVNKNLPITDVKSLITYAKAQKGQMTFAVGSIGSAGHLSTEMLRRSGGFDVTIVPYKGTSPAFTDLIGGQINAFIDPILGSLAYHKNGMLRVVAVTSATRASSLPDVPTVAETIPGYEFYSWYGLWGPAKLPKDVTQKLNDEVNKALASKDLKDLFTSQGLILTPGSTQDFSQYQHDEMVRAQKIITEGNIHVE